MSEQVEAPWTEEQVAALNDWQRLGYVHEFTCGGENCREALVASLAGWTCPRPDCTYTQSWAWDFMMDRRSPIWRDPLAALTNTPTRRTSNARHRSALFR
jgi:hypothetical protein